LYVLKPALLLIVLAVCVSRNGIYRFIHDSLLIPLTFSARVTPLSPGPCSASAFTKLIHDTKFHDPVEYFISIHFQ